MALESPQRTRAIGPRGRELPSRVRPRMGDGWVFLVALWALAAGLRLAVWDGYASTDREVHRNWLAVTQLPLARWYADATSPWTLDYPPLFAWLEWALSWPASVVDPGMLRLQRDAYAAPPRAVAFLRLSVVALEAAGLAAAARALPDAPPAAWAALLLAPPLLFVDHVHFQYNGALLALLLVAAGAVRARRPYAAALAFSLLLYSKHLFLAAAPAFGCVLLADAVRAAPSPAAAAARVAGLGLVFAAVSAAALGPFVAVGQGRALLARLFPFGRGLVHAYWAPNAWALYSAAEKALARVAVRAGWRDEYPVAALAGGLTHSIGQEAVHGAAAAAAEAPRAYVLLPDVRPAHTVAITLLALAPLVVTILRRGRPQHMLLYAAASCWTFFLFSWHVHEKAALVHATALLAAAAVDARWRDSAFVACALAGSAVLPLLHPPEYFLFKWSYFAAYTLAGAALLSPLSARGRAVQWAVGAYVAGLLLLPLLEPLQWLVPALQPYPFLPLMAYSVYGAVGQIAAWADLVVRLWRLDDDGGHRARIPCSAAVGTAQ